MKPTILFLFNSSSYAMKPWLDDGRFNVVAVDYSDTDHSGSHGDRDPRANYANIDLSQPYALAMVRSWLFARHLRQPSLVVSFAPCTDLAVSGAAHFAKKLEADPFCQDKAVAMARMASYFRCPYVVENPVSVLATKWRKPDYYWHPCDYAGWCPIGEHPEFPDVIPPQDRYNKKTGAWHGNGFVPPEKVYLPPVGKDFPGFTKLGGKSARTKYIRSLTPRGFAQAIYASNRTKILVNAGVPVYDGSAQIDWVNEGLKAGELNVWSST